MYVIASFENFKGTSYHVLDVLSFHFNGSKGTCIIVGGIPPILEPFLKDWANKNDIHLVQCTKDDLKDLDMLFGDISVIIFGMNTFLLKKSLELSLRYYIIKEE